MRIRWCFLTLSVLWTALAYPAANNKSLPANAQVNRIVILKSVRELQLFDGDKMLKSYKVAPGPHPVGAKQRQGDGKTPEGIYKISGRNPKSSYHRSLRVSYPNADDVARARKEKVDPGGDIFIHGLPNGYGWIGKGHALKDWTLGCIAVTNEEIEEIWAAVKDGTTVEIRP
jgi:murein L,D-transpeptidase YafK